MPFLGRSLLVGLVASLLCVSSLGCKPSNNGGGQFTQSGKLRVIATYSILGDLVKHVAGNSAEVVVLVGPDGDAHTFDPTPQDGIAIADATVLFENGAGFETWLDKLYSSSGSKAQRFVVTTGLKLREGECHHKPGEAIEPDHKHEDDPHV